MKVLMWGLTFSLAVWAAAVKAEVTLSIDGKEYTLAALMERCQSIGDANSQNSCFNAVSKLLAAQSGGEQQSVATASEALENLRAVAEYQDEDSGLIISGTDCRIQTVYFNNYFHISRRNVSTIDVLRADFDASILQNDRTTRAQGADSPLSQGVMADGATAGFRGGIALESGHNNFGPKSAAESISTYANAVIAQLPASENQTFPFVLVHPKKSQSSADIWRAFDALVEVCSS